MMGDYGGYSLLLEVLNDTNAYTYNIVECPFITTQHLVLLLVATSACFVALLILLCKSQVKPKLS